MKWEGKKQKAFTMGEELMRLGRMGVNELNSDLVIVVRERKK